MDDVVRVVLVALAGAAALTFGLKALRHWWAERAGQAYELAADRTGTALRAGAAGLAAAVAGVLAFPLLDLGAAHTHPAGSSAAAPVPEGVPAPPPRTPEPAPPPREVRTLDHPADGTLVQLQDGTLVWLPPQYASPHAVHLAFPVVVVHLQASAQADPAATRTAPGASTAPGTTTAPPDLFRGFTLAVQRGLADPFVLVMPTGCGHDAGALSEVAARYRVLPSRTATGLMGVEGDAGCAVSEALANPTRYGAAAGISGQYPRSATQPSPLPGTPAGTPPPPAPAHPSAPGAHPAQPNPAQPNPTRTPPSSPSPPAQAPHTTGTTPLLLATTAGETSAQAAALRLRDALHPRGRDDVRLVDGIPSRRELFAQVAAYLTEKLDGPTTSPAATTPSVSPSAPPSGKPTAPH